MWSGDPKKQGQRTASLRKDNRGVCECASNEIEVIIIAALEDANKTKDTKR
jgi:hypothetical protein